MPIRVLVVDDAAAVRRALVETLEADPGITVVGTAVDGVDAIAKIRDLAPDIVTLDVMMPRLDGLKVLAHTMRERPVRVLMLSSLTHEGAEVTLQALELGAVDFVDKSLLGDPARGGGPGEDLRAKVREIAAVDPGRIAPGPGAPVAPARPAGPPRAGGADLVVIGASTGGPAALQRIVPALPGDLPTGIVIVQHMPVGFTAALAARLDASGPLTVREAAAGELLRPGLALVAPGGVHLTVRRDGEDLAVALGSEPADAPLRPSIDVAMRSAAEAAGARAAGVLLTGMGADGARGLGAIRAAGGRTFAESEETAVVYGMPRAAVELGAAEEVLALDELPAAILRTCT